VCSGSSVTLSVNVRQVDPNDNCELPVPTPFATKAPTFACQVDIRANYALGAPPVRHLYVIYTDAIGRQTVFRGGPTSQNPTKFGPIKAVAAPYTGPGSPDWSASGTDPTVAVASGGSACGSDICLAGEVDRINSMSIPYVAAGPNVKNSISVYRFYGFAPDGGQRPHTTTPSRLHHPTPPGRHLDHDRSGGTPRRRPDPSPSICQRGPAIQALTDNVRDYAPSRQGRHSTMDAAEGVHRPIFWTIKAPE
jgi:hypothetical protein